MMEFDTTNIKRIEEDTWSLLQHGVVNYKANFHTGTVATVHENMPYARTVVLRLADKERRLLRFHSDNRSSKIQHLHASPVISWLFYSSELRLQFRMQAVAHLHTNDSIADEAWQASRLSSKMCYTTSTSPGCIVSTPEPVDFSQKEMSAEQESFARENFCVVDSIVQSIDWLFLHHCGHKRCLIDYVNDKRAWLQA